MHRITRSAAVALALAVVASPVARADLVEVGEEHDRAETDQSACADWWAYDDATGASTSVHVCGYEAVEAGWAEMWAYRRTCTHAGGRSDCTIVVYESPVDPAAVDVDVAGGTGRLAATIDDCTIDISLTGDGEAGGDTWRYGDRHAQLRQGRLELRESGQYDQYVWATATGPACGWPETAEPGAGWLAEGGRDDHVTYVAPDWTALAPVAGVEFGTSAQEDSWHATAAWQTESPGRFVSVRAYGSVDRDGATSLRAARVECAQHGGAVWLCTFALHTEPEAGPGAVVVDIDAGYGRLLGAAGECALDVEIATEGSWTGSMGPQPPGVSADDGAVTVSQTEGTFRYSDGTADGTVCDWAEAAGTGDGRLEAWGERSDDTTVRPVVPAG